MGGRPPCASPQVRGGGGGGGGVQSSEPQPSRSQAGGGTMACAGLLTVCLIRPPAPEPPRTPAPAPAAGPAGHALFQDVFRRADKNDDGKLSFEEFQNYFADGVLSPGELRELFSGVDGHPADNLETEKLCDYFSEHLGVYRPVLAALESLNCAVLTAMDTTKLSSRTQWNTSCTSLDPHSWYMARVIQRHWKVRSEATMEPPVHTAVPRPGLATRRGCSVPQPCRWHWASSSSSRRSGKPGKSVEPPASTMVLASRVCSVAGTLCSARKARMGSPGSAWPSRPGWKRGSGQQKRSRPRQTEHPLPKEKLTGWWRAGLQRSPSKSSDT
ncbi:N-terminal EF-hand calcium-binding protein 3 isoform X2 [Bos mutus]|uniref:N-terminal EF-hand calcium-binding protein 3 isoform X2 n=1 Tax=Bos mutus TaxID=72004 RepID=UPI0038B54103